MRGLIGAGSLMTVVKELSKYKLALVRVQEVRWEEGGTELAGEYAFFYGKGNENHEFGTGFLCTIISADKKLEFVSDRMSYIILHYPIVCTPVVTLFLICISLLC
jgi:hypothetical protein